MKCVICKNGETKVGEVTVTLQRGASTVILKNVPADICENWGEYYLSDVVAELVTARIETAVRKGAEVEILHFAA
jgi:YgiT-type zinc finger domain-containing protein